MIWLSRYFFIKTEQREMSRSPPRPPPPKAVPPPPPSVTPHIRSHPLNTNGTPFSSSSSISRTAGEELFFGPSSSEGRSPTAGCPSSPSWTPSYMDMAQGKGKSSTPPKPGCSKWKALMDMASSSGMHGDAGSSCPTLVAHGAARQNGGFMVNARHDAPVIRSPRPQPSLCLRQMNGS
jgi:hypothetical protein